MKKFLISIFCGLLFVGTAVTAQGYLIQRGDTLASIAERFDISVEKLSMLNNIKNPDLIFAGNDLVLQDDFASQDETVFGGAAPVTDYESNTTQYISGTATTIPVASTKDRAGNEINISLMSGSSTPYAYFNIEPGTSRSELTACSGKSVGNWSSCVRGLNFQGGAISASSTLQKAHNAGSRIIMTNIGQFYSNEFFSLSGDQRVWGVKTFDSFPAVSSSSALPVNANQLANKLYVDNVGAGGFTVSNVSTTLGLQAISSGIPACVSGAACVGINASSTGGLGFYPGTGTLLVNVSSTASTNGGFLEINQVLNRLFWNPISFLSGSWTWSNPQTFNTTTTFNGSVLINSTSTNGNGAINFNSLITFAATGTAGSDIYPGDALFISTTSTLFPTDSSVASSTYAFIGVALTAASSTQTVQYTRPGGINCYFSGLSSGYSYYLNGAKGQTSLTAGTLSARIGRAITVNCLQLLDPKFIASGTVTITSTGNFPVTLGFFPVHIDIRAGDAGVGGRIGGSSVGDDSNFCITSVPGIGTTGQAGFDATKAWKVYDDNNSLRNAGTVSSKTNTGFILNSATHASEDATVEYVAYSE